MIRVMKKHRWKMGVFAALMCSTMLFTACGSDKKVEAEANKVADAVSSKDVSKLDAIINGVDDLAADDELADFFTTDDVAGNGLMTQIVNADTVEVKKVGKETITYKITAPDLSNLFVDIKADNVSAESAEQYLSDYISKAEQVTTEVEVPYTNEDGNFSADYSSEEFMNALTGNLVTAYQGLVQDAVNEISEEDAQ